jgi:hypothetical protein
VGMTGFDQENQKHALTKKILSKQNIIIVFLKKQQ